MKIDKEFLYNWRLSYEKMINEARTAVCDCLREPFHIYLEKYPPKPMGKLKKFNRKILSVIFRFDEKIWDDMDKNVTEDESNVFVTMDKLVDNDPQIAEQYRGLVYLGFAINSLRMLSNYSSNKWRLTVLKDFCDIYDRDPNINDIDAMVSFIVKEDIFPKNVDKLYDISDEFKNSINLHLDENLKPFVEEYANKYADDNATDKK